MTFLVNGVGIVLCAFKGQFGAASKLALLRQSQQFVFSSKSEKSLLGMFIKIVSEYKVRCGTDFTRSMYYTCSDIYMKLSLVAIG